MLTKYRCYCEKPELYNVHIYILMHNEWLWTVNIGATSFADLLRYSKFYKNKHRKNVHSQNALIQNAHTDEHLPKYDQLMQNSKDYDFKNKCLIFINL